MRASELKDELLKLMLDTGQGHKPVVFLAEDGTTYDVEEALFDLENNLFFLRGTETDL